MKITTVIIALLFLISCKPNDDDGRDVYNIRYEVEIIKDNQISILYNSDYNIDSGNSKTVEIPAQERDSLTWVGTRLQNNRSNPYSITVSYKDYKNPKGLRHGIFVYANDIYLLDSITVTDWSGDITLEGEIPLNF